MVHVDELHREPPRLHHLARLAGDQLGPVQQAVLLQLQLDKAGGHAGGIDRGVDGPQDIGQGPDVVLVTVGDEDAPDLVLVLDEVAHVGDDHVDPIHVVVGEAHTAVHDHDIPPVFIDGDVLADLIEAAKRDDLQFFCHDDSFLFHISMYPDRNGRRKTAVPMAQRPDEGPLPHPALPRRWEMLRVRLWTVSVSAPQSVPACPTVRELWNIFRRRGGR